MDAGPIAKRNVRGGGGGRPLPLRIGPAEAMGEAWRCQGVSQAAWRSRRSCRAVTLRKTARVAVVESHGTAGGAVIERDGRHVELGLVGGRVQAVLADERENLEAPAVVAFVGGQRARGSIATARRQDLVNVVMTVERQPDLP